MGGGHYSIEIQVWGEGPATLFRDGLRYEGRWQRNDSKNMLTFTDLDGNVLPFKPGNTWVEVVPTYYTIGLNSPDEASSRP